MKITVWEESGKTKHFLELTSSEAEKLEEALRLHREGKQIHCITLNCRVNNMISKTDHSGRIQLGIVEREI